MQLRSLSIPPLTQQHTHSLEAGDGTRRHRTGPKAMKDQIWLTPDATSQDAPFLWMVPARQLPQLRMVVMLPLEQ